MQTIDTLIQLTEYVFAAYALAAIARFTLYVLFDYDTRRAITEPLEPEPKEIEIPGSVIQESITANPIKTLAASATAGATLTIPVETLSETTKPLTKAQCRAEMKRLGIPRKNPATGKDYTVAEARVKIAELTAVSS